MGFETARAEQKAFGKQVAAAKGADKAALVAEVKTLAERVKTLEAQAGLADEELAVLMRSLGNVILDGVPAGGEEDFAVREVVGTPRDFSAEGFTALDHLQLGELHDAIDIERGARVAGSRFYYLKGVGARLENAVMALCQQVAHEEGHVPLSVPNLVKAPTMAGAGFLDAHADEVYYLPGDELYLTGTSEVGLAGYHLGEILDLALVRFGTSQRPPAIGARPEATARTPGASSAPTSSRRPRCSSTAISRTPMPSTSGCCVSSVA